MSDRTPPRDPRKIHVPAPGSRTSAPPPRPGTPPSPSAGRSSSRATAATQPPRKATSPAPPAARASRPIAPPGAPANRPTKPRSKGRKLPRRPKLRRILLLSSLFLPVLLLLTVAGGWLYAQRIYDRVEKIPLTDVLTAEGGAGTNYLIVGSDTRDPQALVDAGLNPAAFEDGGGQRSDTMLLLRFVGGKATMMSIPRDLYVPIADTGVSAKINSAYSGGGARRLILTLRDALQIPVHHYMEVDFVSFAGLVDSLGGITIDFPNPAYDKHTGLSITQAGPNQLNGPQALEYVRSRYYVEVINGQDRPDATSDLGRVTRQQQFLKAVFQKLGDTRNPLALASAGSEASGGLKVDDALGLSDALRLAWRLRSLDPAPVVLPTKLGSNSAGSVLFLVNPDAEAALAQFR